MRYFQDRNQQGLNRFGNKKKVFDGILMRTNFKD